MIRFLIAMPMLFVAKDTFAYSKPEGSTKLNIPDRSQYTNSSRYDSQGIPRALYNINSASYAGTPEQAARAFLSEREEELGNSGSDLRTAAVLDVPGGTHVRFTQLHEGIPVFRGDVVVSLNASNQVGMIINNFRSDIRLASTRPAITSAMAIAHARERMNITGTHIGKHDDATLMIYQHTDGKWFLAYRVEMTNASPYGDWEIFVDATNGGVLSVEDRFVNHTEGERVQGTGYVFRPDPLSAAARMYNTAGFTDGNDADSDSLNLYRTLVTLDSITFEDGVYKLKGPYGTITDIESPSDPQFYSAQHPDGFRFTRSEQSFEAVNVYYHVSEAYRHIERLGFSIPSLRQVRLDPHGYYGQDNSHFSPSGNWISWGEGGVDDAEDADVIWHEYGHAIQFNIVPTWGGGESGALGEGFGDYWAASYSRSMGQWDESSYHHNWVFNWDGHNPFWSGRILNDPRTYPFASLPIHSAGQIWSAALMGIWGELGREVTDKLVLKSFMYLGSGATAPDNAHALIQADRDLYNGAHIQTLLYWLGTVKRFISPDGYVPHITHVPITNSANVFGPFAVQVSVTSQHGVGNNGVTLFWGVNGNFTETATMQKISATEFRSNIPGIGLAARYQYYIQVVDSLGNAVKSPQAAPVSFHQFQAGVDSVAPTIIHTPLSVCTQYSWPLNVSAEVVDDFGVDSVWVEYSLGANVAIRSFRLLPTDQGTYAGIFTLSSSEVNPGDSIHYRVLAADMSIAANTSISPDGGYHTIHIESTSGVDELAGVPHHYALGQNYPNPFNPSTTIRFELPENSAVVLTVHDITGREIATLVREIRNAGAHTVQWDGRNAHGENASSGVYFYMFNTLNEQNTVIITETKKMLLVR